MQLLLKSISNNDALAGEALAIIRTFEMHEDKRSSLSRILESVTRFVPCRVSVRGGDGKLLALKEHASITALPDALIATRQDFGSSASPLGTLCIETVGLPDLIGRCVLDCAARAIELSILRERYASAHENPTTTRSSATNHLLLTTALDQSISTEERKRALRLLDLTDDSGARVVMVALNGSDPLALKEFSTTLGESVISTEVNRHVALIWVSSKQPEHPGNISWPPCVRVGVGSELPVIDLPNSGQEAESALQFTHTRTQRSRVQLWDDLGTLEMLNQVPATALKNLPDVQALYKMSMTDAGLADIELLETLCSKGTVRAASSALYRHHTSFARRLVRVEIRLGFNPTEPRLRGRLHAALAAWRKVIAAEDGARA